MSLTVPVFPIRVGYQDGDTVRYRDVSLTLPEIRAAADLAGYSIERDMGRPSRPGGVVETGGPISGKSFLRQQRPEWLAPVKDDPRLHSMAEKLARSEGRAEEALDRATRDAQHLVTEASEAPAVLGDALGRGFKFQERPWLDEAPFRLLCRDWGLKVWVRGRAYEGGAIWPGVRVRVGAPYAIVARPIPRSDDPLIGCSVAETQILAFPLHPNQTVYPGALLAAFDGRGGYEPFESLAEAKLGDKGPEDFPL